MLAAILGGFYHDLKKILKTEPAPNSTLCLSICQLFYESTVNLYCLRREFWGLVFIVLISSELPQTNQSTPQI